MARRTHAPSTQGRTTAEQREQSRERRRARLVMLAAPATPALPIHHGRRNAR